jgi:phosphatidylserine decarboxylase
LASSPSLLDSVLVPIHRDGWPIIGAFAAGALALAWVSPSMWWVGAALTAWCTLFFRDPPRVTPVREGLIVSPADGVVQWVAPAPPPPELGLGARERMRVSVFMNVFDVHVNRMPTDGAVAKLAYRPGKFFNASLDKASEDNERQGIVVRSDDGREVAVVQIAGLIARRITCRVREGERVEAGQRFGLIRFGSRVDVYLPDGVEPLVARGQRAVAGETVIADVRAQEPARQARRR